MKTCILAIQRYENIKDIEEWIDYHINLGFDHIFLMDNNDEKDALDIKFEYLTIIPYYGQRNDGTDWIWQREAYNFGIEYIKTFDYDWISIIDIDEFITLYKQSHINNFIYKECINKGFDNIELIWELYNDDNKIYHKDSYDGNILNTYKSFSKPDINNVNTIDKFNNMKGFTKFIGKIKPELYYKESAHFPAKELYNKCIYTWNLCDPEIAVIRHYKYKSLEDFISLKCKQRNYVTSVHGSTWKYSRTYFEDNQLNINKIFHFAMFDFKYKLNMEQWDIEYLHQLLVNLTNNEDRKWFFDIWFGANINNEIINDCILSRNIYCEDFSIIYMNESNLNLDICPYTRFMYDHKLYGICADFYKCLLLYYFGGVYSDRDVKFLDYLGPYFENNDYVLFDSSFYNLGAWFTKDHLICSSFMMSKPFNPIFKQFIDYCNEFTYEQLEEMYNTMSKKDFMDYFYDVKIFYYHVIQKYNYNVECLDNINKIIKHKDNKIFVYDNFFIENYKYDFLKDKKPNINQLLIHYNIKTHEQIYL